MGVADEYADLSRHTLDVAAAYRAGRLAGLEEAAVIAMGVAEKLNSVGDIDVAWGAEESALTIRAAAEGGSADERS